jgi:protein-disulfide isomerase
MKQKTVFLTALVLLVALFAGGAQWYRSETAREAAAAAAKNRESLVRLHSPGLGRPEAPVHIVEFLDPACETCAAFYPIVKKMLADNREDIRLSVRYAPFHRGSDEVVKALEASRKQAKFWPALDALIASQPAWAIHHQAHVELIWPHLERAGLDIDRLKADMQSPEVARVVAQDLEDARTLNVTKTPEFFVNGRPLPSFGLEQLRTLVSEELGLARQRVAARN